MVVHLETSNIITQSINKLVWYLTLVTVFNTKKVGSIILVLFWRSVDNRHSLLSLMQMVMPFVWIAACRWNVEVQGFQTSKNTIRKVTPAKMLEISMTRIRRKRTQAYSTILKGQKPLQFPRRECHRSQVQVSAGTGTGHESQTHQCWNIPGAGSNGNYSTLLSLLSLLSIRYP